MIWSGLLGFMLTAGLLIAVPIAACVAWLSSRGRFHRFGRVLAFASAGVLSTLVAYVASGMLRRASGLLLAETFGDLLVVMAIGAFVGSVLGALRRSAPRADSKAS